MVVNIHDNEFGEKINAFRFSFKIAVTAENFIIAKEQIPVLITVLRRNNSPITDRET